MNALRSKTPADQGFRLPAEWEPHAATWLAWPHAAAQWPGKFKAIPWVFGEIIRQLARHEKVMLLVPAPAQRREARRILADCQADLQQVAFMECRTGRGWTRDGGPIFLVRATPASACAILRAGGPAPADEPAPVCAAETLALPLLDAHLGGRPVALAGGMFDGNGRGTVLVTEECLLEPATHGPNPGFTRQDYEKVFRDCLGATNTLWLGRGIAGDPAPGRVDNCCRFVNEKTVVLGRAHKSDEANYPRLEENRERLSHMQLESGRRPEVVCLPMPAPLFFRGVRLPASYANFYIANEVVLVPTFNDPNDRAALGILQDCFPARRVVGIHAVDLVWGLGALHCLAHEQPAGSEGEAAPAK